MGAKNRKVLQVVTGWQAVELALSCVIYGLWQFLKISLKRLWKGHRRKYGKSLPPVELAVDGSIGTHCYIKILGVKYHYVETGPKYGDLVLVLGDAPGPGLFRTPSWLHTVSRLTNSGFRVITLDLRGSGGSENGSRRDLSPPTVVEEMAVMIEALGASEAKPAIVVGNGIGGMLTWYLVHSKPGVISKFIVIDAPHPNLYWQYPPATFCQNVLHFIQWPSLPEQWLAEREASDDKEISRWANSRASDWSGALNYVRGAAWWHVRPGHKTEAAALLVGRGDSAAQLVASAEMCARPTLRLVAAEEEICSVVTEFLIVFVYNVWPGPKVVVGSRNPPGGSLHPPATPFPWPLPSIVSEQRMIREKHQADYSGEWRGGIMGRMIGAVAEKGRGLSARLLLPPS